MAQSITLQTSDNDIIASDVLGRLSFAASSESSGSDAILIGASIYAMAESDFTAIANATSIIFATSSSESAAAKLKISSQGHFLPILNKTYDIGASGTKFRNVYAENGKFENVNIANLSDPYEILYITDADGNVSSTNFLKVDVANSGLDLNGDIVGTGNINILGNITANTGNLDLLSFNVNDESPLLKGDLSWDDTEGTLSLGLTDNSTIHFGEHRYFRVRNETGGVLYKGQVVYASGVHANGIIEPALYVADGTIREVRFMGVILEDVNNQNNGYAIDFGHLEEMDLDGSAANYAVGDETWVAGDILYVHPTVAGKLTKNEPKHSISVAIVLDPGNGNGNGRMFVRPTSYGHLDDNHDVAVSGATNGQFLQYNSATDYWVPSSSGNFTTLQLNGTTVSVSGHSHVSSDITNFNSSVSGLLPTIANSGDNRILTSTGSTVGINAESNLIFDGTALGIATSSPTLHSDGAKGIHIDGTTNTAEIVFTTNTASNGTSVSFDGNLRINNDEPSGNVTIATSGTTRFIIDSSGKVGIGVTPATAGSSALQVRGDLDIFGNGSDRSITYNVGLGDDGITGWYRGKIAFIPSSATNKVSTHIAFFNKDGDLGFSTLTERMRITSDGSVGIGTSNPSALLEVAGSCKITGGITQNTSNVVLDGTGNLRIFTTDTQAIDKGGQIGLGGANGYGAPFDPWAFGVIKGAKENGTSGNFSGYLAFGTASAGGTISERLRITSTGNVGIGTSSPIGTLTVSTTASASFPEAISITGSYASVGDGRAIVFGDTTRYIRLRDVVEGGAQVGFSIDTNQTNSRLYITHGGNVGIGTTTPSAKLDVAGNATITASSGIPLTLNGSSTALRIEEGAGETIDIYRNVSDGLCYFDANQQTFSGFVFRTTPTGGSVTERLRIDSTGQILVTAGGASAPGVAFNGDTNTGIAQIGGADTLSLVASGAERLVVGSSNRTFVNGNGEQYGFGVRYVNTGGAVYFGATSSSATPDAAISNAGGGTILLAKTNGEVIVGGTTDQGAYNLQCNGTGVWGAGAYVNGSDERIKDDITPLGEATSVIAAMQPVTFRYKATWSSDRNIQPGFVAQQLQEALAGTPYLDGVVQQGTEYLSVAYQSLIPLLVKALQESNARIAALEERLNHA